MHLYHEIVNCIIVYRLQYIYNTYLCIHWGLQPWDLNIAENPGDYPIIWDSAKYFCFVNFTFPTIFRLKFSQKKTRENTLANEKEKLFYFRQWKAATPLFQKHNSFSFSFINELKKCRNRFNIWIEKAQKRRKSWIYNLKHWVMIKADRSLFFAHDCFAIIFSYPKRTIFCLVKKEI